MLHQSAISPRMDGERACMLAQANREHFRETTFDGSCEIGVRLNTIDNDNAIGTVGCTVNMNGEAVWERSQHIDLKRRNNRSANVCFGHTQTVQDLLLPFSSRASVTAHR